MSVTPRVQVTRVQRGEALHHVLELAHALPGSQLATSRLSA
jgi:hypothetical protein